MIAKGQEVPDEFIVQTSSFYSPSGFDSGDLLRPAFPPLSKAEIRELLVEVLYQHVIPRLDQKVQALQIPTVRNPLRATSVDGVPVSWSGGHGSGPPITPATVRVSLADVQACAKSRRIEVSPRKV